MLMLKRLFSLSGLIILSLVMTSPYGLAQQKSYPDLSKTKELIIKRGYSKEALQCIECHSKKHRALLKTGNLPVWPMQVFPVMIVIR